MANVSQGAVGVTHEERKDQRVDGFHTMGAVLAIVALGAFVTFVVSGAMNIAADSIGTAGGNVASEWSSPYYATRGETAEVVEHDGGYYSVRDGVISTWQRASNSDSAHVMRAYPEGAVEVKREKDATAASIECVDAPHGKYAGRFILHIPA